MAIGALSVENLNSIFQFSTDIINGVLGASTILFLWLFRADYRAIFNEKKFSDYGILISTTITLLINVTSLFTFAFVTDLYLGINIDGDNKAALFYALQSLLMLLYLLSLYSAHKAIGVAFYSLAKISSVLACTVVFLQLVRLVDRLVLQTDMLSIIYRLGVSGINVLISLVTCYGLYKVFTVKNSNVAEGV